jgi:hypothetical protein
MKDVLERGSSSHSESSDFSGKRKHYPKMASACSYWTCSILAGKQQASLMEYRWGAENEQHVV